jgi:hypothetical protein
MPDRPSISDRSGRLTRPKRDDLVRWLESEAVVDGEGRVWSWHNPEHPGYAYPEAGGLWLALMAREPEVDEARLDRVTQWLRACERAGGIGRDGREYLFDHAMVVAGRLAWAERRGLGAEAERGSIATMLEHLRNNRATSPAGDHARWSERFGPHLLKLALPLARWVEHVDDAGAARALARLLGVLRSASDDGRVPSLGDEGPTYLHACCYAAEGLWRLSEAPLPRAVRVQARARAEEIAAWLARVQRADGGLPPWHDGTHGWGPAPADVAAQAVRLWSGLDRRTHGDAIERALGFLATLVEPCGGVRYHEDSRDLNTWATLFTVQALEFADSEADVRRLV